MRSRLGLLALMLVALTACDVLFPDVPEPNLTGVGPSATEAAVEINYPEDSPPLAISYLDLAIRWNEFTAEAGVIPPLPTEAVEGVVTATNDLSGVVLDVDTSNGRVQIAQLFLQKGSRDDDLMISRLAIDAFMKAVSAEDGPLDSTKAALGIGESIFTLREGEAVLGEARLWLAANEDGLLLGAIGR